MSYNVQVRRAAELDIAEAQLWYEAQRNGLGANSNPKSRRLLNDWLRVRSSTKLLIKMFAERLFIAFPIPSGIEFSVT